jgi:hypothetical protein
MLLRHNPAFHHPSFLVPENPYKTADDPTTTPVVLESFEQKKLVSTASTVFSRPGAFFSFLVPFRVVGFLMPFAGMEG